MHYPLKTLSRSTMSTSGLYTLTCMCGKVLRVLACDTDTPEHDKPCAYMNKANRTVPFRFRRRACVNWVMRVRHSFVICIKKEHARSFPSQRPGPPSPLGSLQELLQPRFLPPAAHFTSRRQGHSRRVRPTAVILDQLLPNQAKSQNT